MLDLSSRLGARYVTACGVPRAAEESSVEEEFGQLVRDADDYQLVPLLIDQPGTGVTTPAQALELVRGTGGGVIITVSTRQTALDIEAQVLDAGNRLGYLRLLAEDLDAATEDEVAGLLATVPVHVPIAVGSRGHRVAGRRTRRQGTQVEFADRPDARTSAGQGPPGGERRRPVTAQP